MPRRQKCAAGDHLPRRALDYGAGSVGGAPREGMPPLDRFGLLPEQEHFMCQGKGA